jgi:hypothetical protein
MKEMSAFVILPVANALCCAKIMSLKASSDDVRAEVQHLGQYG